MMPSPEMLDVTATSTTVGAPPTTLVSVADFAEAVGGVANILGNNPWLKFAIPFGLGCIVGLVINAFIIYTAWYIPPETMQGWQQVDDNTLDRVMGGENWEEIVAGSQGKYKNFPGIEKVEEEEKQKEPQQLV